MIDKDRIKGVAEQAKGKAPARRPVTRKPKSKARESR
jgi:hypothetical protein